jgi:hypothetical protein
VQQPYIVGNLIFDAGTTDVPSAGSRVALSSDGSLHANFRIVWARFRGDPGNTGTVYVGVGDVSATNGWSLENNDDTGLELPIPRGGSIRLGDINFDVSTSGDDVEWAILYQGV